MVSHSNLSATPQLRELDEISSSVFCLIEPYLELLGDRHGMRQKGLSTEDIVGILFPYLYHEVLPLEARFRRERDVHQNVAKLFREATGNRPHTLIFWDPFVEFLAEGHRRHMLRLSQRLFPSFSFLAARAEPLPLGIRQACSVASADLPATVVLRDVHHRRVIEFYDDKQWTVMQGPSDTAQSAVFGMPVAMAAVPAPYHHVAVCTTSSSGSSLVFLERTGRVSHEVSVVTHFSCMQWMPRLNRLVCGSILGEITEWLASGKVGPSSVQPHNGPIVALGHMQILDAIVSVGTDGRVAVTDAHTITEIVRGVVSKDHVTCGAFHPEMNVVAVGGTSTHLTVCSASLPHQRMGNVMTDVKNPHRYIVTDVRFHQDALLSLDAGGTVKVWDVRTARCMDTIHAPLSDEQRRVSPFSRMFPVEPRDAASSASIGIVGDTVTLLFGPDSSKSTQFVVRAEDELVRFVDVAKHGSLALLITATSSRIRLWSCRSGELLGELASPSEKICAMTAFDAAHSVFFATTTGEVWLAEFAAVLEGTSSVATRWAALPRSNGKGDTCELLVVCFPLVLCCTGSATYLLDGRQSACPQSPVKVDGIRSCLRAEVFSDLSAVGLMSADAKLFVVEPSDTDHGVDVEDFREYNIVPALRYAEEPFSANFCFLGTPTLVSVSDGPDVSIILLSSIRCRRLLSFSSVSARVVGYAFECANMRSVLVTAEADGGCAVYVLNEFLDKLSAGKFAQCSFDNSAPQLHLSFTAPFSSTMALMPFLSVLFCASPDGSCAVYRFDGVKVGDLDQFQSGTASRWLPLSTKTRRGSNIVFRSKFDVEKTLNDGLHCRHGTRLQSHSPAPSDVSLMEQLRDPLATLSFKKRLKAVTGGVGSPTARTQPIRAAPEIVSIRGERSTRTLRPIDLSSAKWTVDDKKEVPVRDGKKVMMGVRLLTVGLLPSPELVKETKRLLAPLSPSKSPAALESMSRSLMLKPLLVKPPTPFHPGNSKRGLEVLGCEVPLSGAQQREGDVDDEDGEVPQNFFVV